MQREFEMWGLSKVMLRNIVVGVIMLLCMQVVAVTAYFRAELEAERSRTKAAQEETRECMDKSKQRLERFEEDYLTLVKEALGRQDKLEAKVKKALAK